MDPVGQAALACLSKERVEIVERQVQDAFEASTQAAQVRLVRAARQEHEMNGLWHAAQGLYEQPVTLGALDGADRHDDVRVRRQAELGSDGRRLSQEIEAELSQVDGVVDAHDGGA